MARSSRISHSVKVYRVGGSVRDELLGRGIADRDWVVVGATPEILIASGYKPVGRDFPVFLHPETREEYALARTERKHGRGYRGFEFFVSPDVTLDEDLARRDLTINAMARDERGALIDPFGGEADLRAGVLRHVSPAFVEDPLRVLRVARFAARFGFAVAPATAALMRKLAASGELALLAPERVWQELARGLMEGHPSRMLAVLRDCGALGRLLPEVDALFAAPRPATRPATRPEEVDAGTRMSRALDYAAARAFPLTVRYAVLADDLGGAESPASIEPKRHGPGVRNVRLAERVSRRLRTPVECRDAARLAARWLRAVHRARELRPAALLDLLTAADALRRPARLDALLDACECAVLSLPRAGEDYAAARIVRAALAVVNRVDAGAIARAVTDKRRAGAAERADATGKAIRAARLEALRVWRRTVLPSTR
jgi:tRNA nucleotidyltransferase (CCA-adding enzyme)